MKRLLTEVKIQRWIKEGRGSGHGKDYKPWFTVRDFPSRGKVHRVFGHKSGRTHHLLSNLELAVFLISEWHVETLEIREQFPLRIAETPALAEEARITHPSGEGTFQVLTSDFLVNTTNHDFPKIALQAIYSKSLQSSQTIEKLELERRYWESKNVPWNIVTEKDIPTVAFKNIEWMYPAQRFKLPPDVTTDRVQFYTHHFIENPSQTIVNLCKKLDLIYDMSSGESLREIRELIAQRCFIFDLFTPARLLKSSDLKVADIALMKEVWRVSG